ncbi:PREDICTED: N6-adenosine-methyltransferase 70 kDa subunit [Papilio polytes]|uniref:N6-adenosine-methyltransferase 70 kDa subunit n=1 Tax=Papilio polytes TaxID=76194 RepID=UPI00067686D8|nr:PREDICTED: N6-adenosine-methyltransferase 70 kDa subunit [Papilio polytes]
MSDAWEEIQAVKSKRNSLREKLEKRKKERQNILGATLANDKGESSASSKEKSVPSPTSQKTEASEKPKLPVPVASLEVRLLQVLSDMQLQLPATASALIPGLGDVDTGIVASLLQKFATQKLITIKERLEGAMDAEIEVVSAESVRLGAVLTALIEEQSAPAKRKGDSTIDESTNVKVAKSVTDDKKTAKGDTDIMSLLAMPSSREKAVKRVGEEIMDLLSKPTAKEKSLADKFKSQGGAQVMEFCPHGTRAECVRNAKCEHEHYECKNLHKYSRIFVTSLCFFRYVHYEVDNADPNITNKTTNEPAAKNSQNGASLVPKPDGVLTLTPPQWIQCDLRYLDMTFLAHYMSPMRRGSEGSESIFLKCFCTRAMELGRECLKLWGYERVDELIWVKTNQLQRIIRTGRTGHWLNHGKEHCLVGMKGNPENLNRGLDCDVIVAEVRATSHKPDEIYGIIERLSPGTRKIELFGRPHNVQPNWITLGNQVDGVRLVEPDLIAAFKKRYPDGNCMAPPADPGLA